MNMRPAVGLCLGVSLVASGCTAPLGTAATTAPCPPRATGLGGTSSPTLAAGGKGVAPREAPAIDEGVSSDTATPHLVSGGRGVVPRLDAPSPQGPSIPSTTPRLVAGPRGTAARPDCD